MLLKASSDIVVDGDLERFFKETFGQVKLIAVEGSPRALIVKTTDAGAKQLRGVRGGLNVRGNLLVPVLTSGAVGNLKKRGAGASANGKVHE